MLDCRTLDYTYAPFVLKEHDVIIINTNKQRTLAGSKYNERRTQCEEALGDLQQELSIASLGELTMEGFEAHQHLIRNEINQNAPNMLSTKCPDAEGA
ncbi:hypothetical protein PO124_02275 [Bacillus licheniformis]|nr:hypothetical protein [Bacillus licheniformis]